MAERERRETKRRVELKAETVDDWKVGGNKVDVALSGGV